MESINSSRSADEAMAALEPLLHPDIEWVNPPDAIEPGTRRGMDGMRLMLENLFAGGGPGWSNEIEGIDETDGRALVLGRPWVHGESSGAEVLGPPVTLIFTVQNALVHRVEWHFDIHEAHARFEATG